MVFKNRVSVEARIGGWLSASTKSKVVAMAERRFDVKWELLSYRISNPMT